MVVNGMSVFQNGSNYLVFQPTQLLPFQKFVAILPFLPKSIIDICSCVRFNTKPGEYLNSALGMFVADPPVEIIDKKCFACKAAARVSVLEPRLVVKSIVPCFVIRS